MSLTWIYPLAVAWVFITALSLLLFMDWRLSVVSLVFQYLGVFILVSMSWPLETSVVKLVAGWMAVGILGMSLVERGGGGTPPLHVTGMIFRGMIAALVGLVVLTLLPGAQEWFVGAPRAQIAGGSFLVTLGLLNLGLSNDLDRILIGLLTVISGFEVMYASVEDSILMTSLLAVVNLGIAFVGAFLLSITEREGEA